MRWLKNGKEFKQEHRIGGYKVCSDDVILQFLFWTKAVKKNNLLKSTENLLMALDQM